jgi:hypothetical protein
MSELARLLIVDDEEAQMRALCDTLREQGYEISGFGSPAQALNALRSNSFDLLLTDLMMPDINGITLLDMALKVDPNLVGIVMTGQGTIDSAVQAMKAGALDYILKPFRLSAILPVLSRALAVRRLRLEKAALEQRLRDRTTELEAANHELEAFAHSVSHDLRAPLRHVEAFIKIVLTDFPNQIPAEATDFLNESMSSAGRMGRLIEDLLRLSRFGQQPLARIRLNMKGLVAEVLQELLKDKGSRLIEAKVGELAECTGDFGLLRQVLVNLLSNALKFTRPREKAVIEIACSREPGQIVYWVRDNGVGFDMQYSQKLFGTFERLHSSSEFEGTGVGLSLVQRIVQRHSGRVWAESALNDGATFYFSLPE